MAESMREVRVFVSSPGDVLPERGRVDAVAAKLNREYESLAQIKTVLWEESFYKADRTFQPQIPEAAACDIVLSIFWTTIGTELRRNLHACPTAGRIPRAPCMNYSPHARADQVASRGQNGRLRPNPSIDDHRNWAAAHELIFRKVVNLWRPINSNDLSVPLDWS